MASGHLALELTEQVSWDEFPHYAQTLLRHLGVSPGVVTDAVDMRMVDFLYSGAHLKVVYEDFPQLVSVESVDAAGDATLKDLYTFLIKQP